LTIVTCHPDIYRKVIVNFQTFPFQNLYLELTLKSRNMDIKWPDVLKIADAGAPPADRRLEKTAAEWKQLLSPEQFRVTRQAGTERAHSSDMCGLFTAGIYACVCCDTHLFDSGEKFESGTGWPSFTQPLKDNVVAYNKDSSYGMVRIEAICNTCDAHLGHVFPDGPRPSGLRYCVNAVSLRKIVE
jgi:methionine-R-sulfoxide reductase